MNRLSDEHVFYCGNCGAITDVIGYRSDVTEYGRYDGEDYDLRDSDTNSTDFYCRECDDEGINQEKISYESALREKHNADMALTDSELSDAIELGFTTAEEHAPVEPPAPAVLDGKITRLVSGQKVLIDLGEHRNLMAVISIHMDHVYFCQNVVSGAPCPQRWGMQYSWTSTTSPDAVDYHVKHFNIRPFERVAVND
jgi:hypothetical protein